MLAHPDEVKLRWLVEHAPEMDILGDEVIRGRLVGLAFKQVDIGILDLLERTGEYRKAVPQTASVDPRLTS
jgi:hypothetical protein